MFLYFNFGYCFFCRPYPFEMVLSTHGRTSFGGFLCLLDSFWVLTLLVTEFVVSSIHDYATFSLYGSDVYRSRHRLKGIHSRSDTSRTGAEGLSFYYPRLQYCLNQMLAVVLLSQHRVSSSKTVRPCASYGARCIGHAVSTWSAVCSEAPHSQFGEANETPFVHGQMESPNTSPQAVELNPSCSG